MFEVTVGKFGHWTAGQRKNFKYGNGVLEKNSQEFRNLKVRIT